MRRNYHKSILLVLICMFCLFPKTASAAEQEKEYNLNKQNRITITREKSHAVTGQYTWLKYVPAEDGCLTIQMSSPEGSAENATGYIALYNSSKSSTLSSKSIFYNTEHQNNPFWYTFSFGLRKNQTYYIRVRGDNGVTVLGTFTKINDTSGISKTKAKSIKANKTKTGLIPAGVSNTDWYKIKLPKQKRLRIYYQAKTTGSFKMTIYQGKNLIGSRNIYYTSGEKKIVLYQYSKTTKKKTGLKKGNYFVSIERSNSASSGYYKIKWN